MIKNKLENILRYLDESEIGQRIYLAAFVINVLGESLGTTMFPVPGLFHIVVKFLTVSLLVGKIIWFDNFSKKDFFLCAGLMGCAVLIWISSGYSEPFMWGLLLIGARGVPFRKILQVYLIVNLAVVFLAFVASLLGVIENLQYTSDENRGIRNSFGIVYTTDFAAHIFFLMLTYFYLKKDRIKKRDYIGAAGITILVYYFCRARLDAACMCILIVIYWILGFRRTKYSLKGRYMRKGLWERYGIYSMPTAALVMTILTVLWGKVDVLYGLDNLLSGRLWLGQYGLKEYGIRLFGQYVPMVGFGSTTEVISNYFFVDCSYLYVLLRYGIVFLLIVLGSYMMCCRKYKRDVYFIITIALISLNCMIAHHIVETAYNPFAWSLLALMDTENMTIKRKQRDEDYSIGCYT